MRAYHKRTQTMYEVQDITWTEGEEHKPAWLTLSDTKRVPADTVILMSSTGLTDVTGKEIYEGDILKRGIITYVIEYTQGTFTVDIYPNQEHVLLEDLPEVRLAEIIGNVYQHKHMIR